MIQSHLPPQPLTRRSYLVIVEQQPDVDDEYVQNSMSGALYWVEGVGEIEVVPMGEYVEADADQVRTAQAGSGDS